MKDLEKLDFNIFLIGFISESRKALLMYARLLILSLFTV